MFPIICYNSNLAAVRPRVGYAAAVGVVGVVHLVHADPVLVHVADEPVAEDAPLPEPQVHRAHVARDVRRHQQDGAVGAGRQRLVYRGHVVVQPSHRAVSEIPRVITILYSEETPTRTKRFLRNIVDSST